MIRKTVFAYIVFISLLAGIAPLLPSEAAIIYVSVAILLGGLVAIVLQKKIHRGRFVDMGFKLNRNAVIGLTLGLTFTILAVLVNGLLPYLLGLVTFSVNTESALVSAEVPILITTSIIVVFGGAILFVCCLFGEELAFRGYILPKLEEQYGSIKAIIICSVVFSLWHLPAYFSVYSGGAAESGWSSVALMLLAHGISVVPICILYLTTRELYGVSLYHALLNVLQYSVVGNPALGEASKDALYKMTVLNEPLVEAIGWAWHVAAVFLMIGLCRVARRWTLENR